MDAQLRLHSLVGRLASPLVREETLLNSAIYKLYRRHGLAESLKELVGDLEELALQNRIGVQACPPVRYNQRKDLTVSPKLFARSRQSRNPVQRRTKTLDSAGSLQRVIKSDFATR